MEQQVQNSDALQNQTISKMLLQMLIQKFYPNGKIWENKDNSFYTNTLQDGAGLDWAATCEKTRENGWILSTLGSLIAQQKIHQKLYRLI